MNRNAKKALSADRQSKKGQTIIEVLIATGVVALVMTAIAAGLTYAAKNTAESRFKALATNMSQDGLEVFRRERAILGWDTFRQVVGSDVFCLNELPADTSAFVALEGGECQAGIPVVGTEMRREATVTPSSVGGGVTDTIRVESKVYWFDSGRERSVQVTQEFKEWN